MKYYTFNFEIKDLISQFISAFDDIIIKRYNNKREEQKSLSCRYVYAPKSRVVHDIINKSQHITLPAVAVSITGVSRDPGRVFNKMEGFYYPHRYDTGNPGYDKLPPVNPVNIDVSVSILTKYQSDLDQIITNFVPYANPYIVLSWKIPQAPRAKDAFIDKDAPIQEIRSEVLWSGDIKVEYPTDLKSSDLYRVSADTSFTIKGFLFTKPPAPGSTAPIFDIQSHFVTVDSLDDLQSGSLTDYKGTNNNPA